ncbi:MAG TPA: hypothetical protein HPP50_05555 [Rhodospirillaceae bacterium]|nr:hypothetical protein [Rhodospirillaceae bacterium]
MALSVDVAQSKTLEPFQLQGHLPMAGDVLQEVPERPRENDILKRLTRHLRKRP